MSSGFEIISVSQLNYYVKSQLDSDPMLYNVFLRGEISNFTNHYRSGHFYMSLKDEKSVIKAVMFRGNTQSLKFVPENGMKVIAFGRASLYDRDGQFQFYIEDMQPDGVGALHIAFEQLKTKLACEGLFDEKNKIALPKYPEKIGVVTSPTGAAVQDIFNILSRRWPLANIVLFPVKVQGDKAPSEICKGITSLDNETDCDVIIIGRGGGSIEDLWAFNNENVARTIAACKTPIVSAVGHETDFTIADFVADMRAPTPSAAAELVSPDINEISSHIDKCRNEMNYKVQYLLNDDKQRLDNIYMNPIFKQPESMLWVYQKKFENSENALVKATNRIISEEQKQLSKKCAELEALSPLKVLSRGYSVAKQNKKILKSVKDINYDKNIEVFLHDGSLECEVQNIKEGSFNFNEK